MLKLTRKSKSQASRRRLFTALLHLGLMGAGIAGTSALRAQQPLNNIPLPSQTQMLPSTSQPQTTVRTYDVPSQLVGTVSAHLQLQYHNVAGVTVTTDPRTGQLMVVAPAPVQQQINESVIRLMQQGGIQPGDRGIAAESHDEHNYQLRNLTWRELEDALGRLAGTKLELTTENNGELASLQIPNQHGLKDIIRIDRRHNQVTILGTGPTVAAWSQVVHSLDAGQADADSTTHIVPLAPAQPRSVRRMIQLVKAVVPRQDELPAEDPNNPNAPATAVIDPQGQVTDSGLLGDVQIEVVDSVGLVIIKGSKRDVQRTLQVIQQIKDQAKQTEPLVEVLQLQHSNSEAVGTLVTQLYESVYQPRQGSVSITALIQPNALLLIGRPEVVQSVKELVAKIDQPLDATDELKVIRLEHASAVDLETRVRDFFEGATTGTGAAPGGAGAATNTRGLATRVRVASDFRTNALVVKASPREMVEVEKLIKQLDVESADTENRVQVFPLKHAVAQELQTVITSILTGQAATGQGGAGGQGGGGVQTTNNSRATTPSSKLSLELVNGDKVESGVLAGVIVSADPSVNALVVRAPAPSMPLVAALINQLDVLPSAEARMKIFQLKNGDATTVALTLQNLYGLSPSAGQGSQFALNATFTNNISRSLTAGGDSTLIQLRITPEARSNSVIVSGAESDLQVIEALILRLDQDLNASRRSEVIWLRHANAADVATALQTYFQQLWQNQSTLAQQSIISYQELINRQLFIVADQTSNSVLLSANNAYFDIAMRMIERLDRRPPMVSVQVLVAEVTLSDSLELGAELGLQDSLLYSRGSSSGGTLASPVFGGISAINSPTSAQNLAGQGLSALGVGRSNATGVGGMVLTASSETVGMLVRALQTANRLQILNRPQLTTLDNRIATATVGGLVPRVTGISQATGLNPQQITTTDIDVGLILTVQPRVSPDGLIMMQVGVTNSSVGDTSTGIPIGFGPNGETIRSPIINQTRAETYVSAYSGQTVVFAGLISKNRSTSRNQVPILGSLPLIGPAFRFDVEAETRKELLVVLTPRLIQTDEDYETLKQVESSRMSWCLADVLNIHGDEGLSGGNGLWGPAKSAILFPEMPRGPVPDRAIHNPDNIYPIPGNYAEPEMIEAMPMSFENLEAANTQSKQFQQVSYQSGDANNQVMKPNASTAPNNGLIESVPTRPTVQTSGVQNGMYR